MANEDAKVITQILHTTAEGIHKRIKGTKTTKLKDGMNTENKFVMNEN